MNLLRRRRKRTKEKNKKKYLILLFSLVMTTFAWFTYSRVLNNNLNLHPLAWDISYEINGVKQDNPISVSPEFALYPGMPDQQIYIDIKNNGEVNVDLNYIISSIKILGQEYEITDPEVVIIESEESEDVPDVVMEGQEEGESFELTLGDRTVNDGIIYQKIIDISNKYPFTISVECSNGLEHEQIEGGYMKITISWPDEVVDNAETEENEIEIKNQLDTKWGYEFAKYLSENPEGNAIEIQIEVNATQRLTAAELLE